MLRRRNYFLVSGDEFVYEKVSSTLMGYGKICGALAAALACIACDITRWSEVVKKARIAVE